jgi:DNA invertase Pin-like site-specific DNA recombinase
MHSSTWTKQMTSSLIGYARTSTIDQIAGLDEQVHQLSKIGCHRIFKEHVSSVDQKRPELMAALDYLREGDTFAVTKPDRLARSTRDLLSYVDDLTARGVQVRILSMDLDTGSPTARMLLTMLGAVAEFERTIMKERQMAGIAKAKAEGKYNGRKPTAREKQKEVCRMLDDGASPSQIARVLEIGRSSVYRIIDDREDAMAIKGALKSGADSSNTKSECVDGGARPERLEEREPEARQ